MSRVRLPMAGWAVFMMICLSACDRSEYSKLVENEMSSGIIHDSIFFGLAFGQSREEFYNRCWELNREGLIRQGPKNKFVRYDLPEPTGKTSIPTITMLFYGSFDEEKIMTGMDLQFYHEAWSLWNDSLTSERLVQKVRDSLLDWYPGNEFINMSRDDADFLVKIDGNRRITIHPLDDPKIVKAKIDDLRYVLEK